MTTEEAISRYTREYLEYHRLSDGRIKESVKILTELSAFIGKPVTEVNSSELQQFVGALRKRGFHPNTIRRKLGEIRPFCKWAWQVGEIDADRYLRLNEVKPPRGSRTNTPNPYTRSDIERFWQAVDDNLRQIPEKGRGCLVLKRWLAGKGPWQPPLTTHAMRLQIRALTRLALDLGMRRQEMYGLSLADLHYDNAYLVIRAAKADPNTGHVRVRSVPWTKAAHEAVYEWIEFRALLRCGHDRPWIFCHNWPRRGMAPTSYDMPLTWRPFQTLLQVQVGREWRWHRFRHTCATNWLRAEMPLEAVSRLLGHATLQQTLAYAEILKSDLARQMGNGEDAFAELVGPAQRVA